MTTDMSTTDTTTTTDRDIVRRVADMIYDALDGACSRSLFDGFDGSLRQQVDAYVADVRANPTAMGVTRELDEGFDIEESYRTGVIPLVVTWTPVSPFIALRSATV